MKKEAIAHARSVLEHQPDIDLDDLMLHVESNYPDLANDPDFANEVSVALFGVCSGRVYALKVCAPWD